MTDEQKTAAAMRDFYAVRLSEKIQTIIDKCPPLTAEQADRLRALLPPVK